MNYTKNAHTATLADSMIGAAQVLEQQAKSLKAAAKTIRATGLITWDFDPIENQMLHKAADIKNAATSALQALGSLSASDWLVETDHRS